MITIRAVLNCCLAVRRGLRKRPGVVMALLVSCAIWSMGVGVRLVAAEIVVDVAKPLGAVKRGILGHNVESADPRGIFADTFNAKSFDKQYIRNAEGFWNPNEQAPYRQVVEQARVTGISVLRYPGGCLVSNFDWRKTVGPLAKRGDPDWAFGINEFIELCRALGAEPMITCSDYVLPAEEMPQHLADLVQYLNAEAVPENPWAMKRKESGHSEPFGVRWFELGNESDAGNYYCKPRRCYTKETYAQYAEKSAELMKKVDPSIKIGIQYGVGEKVYQTADFIICHHYGGDINGQNMAEDFKSVMAHVEHYERTLRNRKEDVAKKTGRYIPMALTEYNIRFFRQIPKPYRYSAMAGLYCADMIRMFLQHDSGVELANYWQISNGYFGMINAKDGVITQRRSTLAYYELWGQHLGATQVPVIMKGVPTFEAQAIVDTPSAEGVKVIEAEKVGETVIGAFDFAPLSEIGVSTNADGRGGIVFEIEELAEPTYTNVARIPNEVKGTSLYYRLCFESKFTGYDSSEAVPSAQLGLSLLDSRGWEETQSAVAVDNLQMDSDWTVHAVNFTPMADCTAIDVVFRAPNVASALSGKLEVRNFRIEMWTPESAPAYQGLTAFSSLSADEKTLHLIVLNKSYETDIESTIQLNGFASVAATCWIAGDQPETLVYNKPVETTVANLREGAAMPHTFQKHSMTAIDFVRK